MAKSVVAKNPITRSTDFLREAWAELKKVHAPNRQETIQASLVVGIVVILFAVFLGLADLLVGRAMQFVLSV